MFRLFILSLAAYALLTPQAPAAEPDKFAATLLDGAEIELEAVVRLDKEPRTAWRPDGTPIEISKNWPRILEVEAHRSTHGFVFRFTGFKKGQGLDWRLEPPGVTPLVGETIPEYATVSADIFPTLKSADVRVGVLAEWGPWQRVETTGIRDEVVEPKGLTGRYYRLVEGVEVQSSPASELPVALILQGLSGVRKAADFGYSETIAVDHTGKRRETGGAGLYGEGQLRYFRLKLADTDYYEYRLRPILKWVAFEKIAVKPEKAAVKISVEGSGLEESPAK